MFVRHKIYTYIYVCVYMHNGGSIRKKEKEAMLLNSIGCELEKATQFIYNYIYIYIFLEIVWWPCTYIKKIVEGR